MNASLVCSLNNLSEDIRWSLDLRWQRLDEPTGFYGLKQGVQLASSSSPDLRIDWEEFDSKDRHKLQDENVQKVRAATTELCGLCYPPTQCGLLSYQACSFE